MRSKKPFSARSILSACGFAILASGAISSCSWIRTEPKAVSSFQSASLDLSCIKSIPESLQDLFAGAYTTSTEDQTRILSTFGCIDRALGIFADFTRGASPDGYSARELQGFANRYLPEKTPISDLFIRSIFELKRAIIGGTSGTITKAEIKSLQEKLARFGAVIAPFAGHIQVLLKPDASTSANRRTASIALNRFVLALSGILTDSPDSLAWNDLSLFIRELELFTGSDDTSALTLVREQLPIFQYAKLLLVGGNEGSIESTKWKPIFDSISHFYSALLLTSNTSDLLEQMSLEVQSTEEEQSRAVVKLTGLLRALIRDEHLHSRPTVTLLADRFAKALLLNAFVFPRNQGSLALKPFLETASLRKLSGAIVDQILKLDRDHLAPETLQAIADNAISLLEQAAISNSTSPGVVDSLDLGKVLDYLNELTPLVASPRDFQYIKSGISVLRSLIPILIGREADRLTPKDLRHLITKSLDLYAAWSDTGKLPLTEKIGSSLEILNRAPAPIALTSSQLLKAVDDLAAFFSLASKGPTPDWAMIRNQVNRALKLKAVLYQTPESTITRYELTHLAYIFEPFRKGDDLGGAFIALSSLLRVKNFQNANVPDLIEAVDALLPKELQTRSLGLNPKLISHLKVLFAGGTPTVISRDEFPELARLIGTLYAELKNKIREKFEAGLDSRTADVAASALHAFIEGRRGTLLMTDLKAVLSDVFQGWNLTIRDEVLDAFLIGFHTRVLKKSKAQKPTTLAGLGFQASDLEFFFKLAERIRDELAPIEALYQSMGAERGTLPRDLLLERLVSSDLQKVVKSIQPLLSGPDQRLHFAARGEVLDRYSRFELAYKMSVYKTVSSFFGFYKVTEDPLGPNSPRLNEADLTDLLTDVNDLITELKLSYGYTPAPKSAKSRLRSINLFTRNGNGDDYIDSIETTEFLTITLGGRKILAEIEGELFAGCFSDQINTGRLTTDEISSIPVPCLTRILFKKEQLRKFYSDVAPELTRDVSQWDGDASEEFRKSVLNSIDPRWVESGIIERTDLEALVSVPVYTENLFQRFDANTNSILEFSEAMKGFPVFCEEIKKTGGSSLKGSCKPGENPDQIEAVYGYLLYRGVPPRGIRPTDSVWQRIKAAKDILGWFSFWKKLDKTPEVRDAYPPKIDRRGILKIMSNLSTAPAAT